MIEVVFFDAGDTLLSPNPSWAGLSARVLGGRGHEVDADAMQEAWGQVGGHFRQAADDGVRFSLDTESSRRFWTMLYREILECLGIDDGEAPEVLYRTFSDPANYRLFPDALNCLHALKDRGLVLGVISNFESWLEELLRVLGVVDVFDVVAVSGRLGWEKPDPRIFRWAVEQVGRPASVCAHVGDQPYFDADAAQACGLRGVLLDRSGRYGSIGASYVRIANLTELTEAIEGMARTMTTADPTARLRAADQAP